MPRPPRVEFPGALYHVTARGVEGTQIALDDHDRVRWFDYLREAVLRFGLDMYAYALMSNHFHLFLATPRANLRKAMQYLNGSYAMYFNVRHGRHGHLYERRYGAVLVEDQGHYIEASRYIHLNPVRAGIVNRPEQYPWGSYPGYHYGRKPLPWVNYERVLDEFGEGKEARKRYREFVADGIGKELPLPWLDAVGGWLLGSKRFVAKVYGILASEHVEGRWHSRAVLPKEPVDATIDDIAEIVCNEYRIGVKDLRTAGRRSRNGRSALMLMARDCAGIPLKTIAVYTAIQSLGSVSQAIQRARRRMTNDKQFRKMVSRIKALLLTTKGV